MQEKQNKNSNNKKLSPINNSVEKLLKNLNKDFFIVGKRRVHAWKSWLFIGITAGLVIGIFSVAQLDGFTLSKAAPKINKVTVFIVTNVDASINISQLDNGDIINLNSFEGKKFNITAETSPATTGSVRFHLDGSSIKIDNSNPYTAADINIGLSLSVGTYTLTATPYSKSKAKGKKGTSLQVDFTVIDQVKKDGSRPYDKPDFYGMNVPAVMFPDARGTAGDAAMEEFRGQLSRAGGGWLRTDVSDMLHRAFFRNTECWPTLCDENKIEGFKILGVIDHVTIRTAAEFCSSFVDVELESFTLTDWSNVVDCVSKKFKGKVQAYEIWNEPTLPKFQFGYQDGSPENYFDMLKEAYRIIKENDPDAIVVGMGGVAAYAGGVDGPAIIQTDKDFSQNLIKLGASQYADVISLHAYDWDSYGGWVWDAYVENIYFHGDLWGKDVWITEAGHRATGSGSQSEYLQRAFSLFINEGVNKTFWFALKDAADGAFGIVGRPVHDFFKEFINTPKSGLLRLTTDPAVGATITVKPGSGDLVRMWGIEWEELPEGIYTLSFDYPYSEINGEPIQIPPDTEIEIQSQTTTYIKVNLTEGTIDIEFFGGADAPVGRGLLRVETGPAAEVTITVSPQAVIVKTWGIEWERLESGTYIIMFEYLYPTIYDEPTKLPLATEIEIKAGMTAVMVADLTEGTISIEYLWE